MSDVSTVKRHSAEARPEMTEAERPKLETRPGILDRVLDNAGWIMLALLWIYTAMQYASLPDVIPIHFNASGEPDGTGARYIIWLLPSIATVLSIGLSFLERYPHVYNYPIALTESNVQRQYRLAIRLMQSIRIGMVLLFGSIVVETVLVVSRYPDGLGGWTLPVMLSFVLVPIIVYFWAAHRSR